MSAVRHVLGLVVEGPSDAHTVPVLTDRVLVREVPLREKDLDGLRAFRGLDANTSFLPWSAVDDQARRHPVPRRHGHFGEEPAIEDAHTAVLALRCFVSQDPQPVAVILVRDSDGKQGARVRGLEQARQDGAWPFAVVIGVAHTMRECWVLAGFTPHTRREKEALAALRLGFSPTEHSERLDASHETAKKSPKRVLRDLTRGDREREAQCWTDADLQVLRARGGENGLSAFLDEVTEKLAPIFAGRA